jgi:glycosyltransferase involved in cell wall biosynthesis
MMAYYFDQVTLLVTHYNRSASLERLLTAFIDLNCRFDDIVVSDDGSRPEHIDKLKKLQQQFSFRLVTTPINKGLGHNLNKGQDAVKTDYTLYIQEDFVPGDMLPGRIKEACEFMSGRADLDMVRFWAYFKYPYLKPFEKGFSEMDFKIWYPGYRKFYAYSDHPHLRRSNFLERFGRYTENAKGDVTEYRMMMSYLKKKGRALYYDDNRCLLDTKNPEHEPSTMKRNYWRESNNVLVAGARHCYRYIKFNYDYFFMDLG